MRIKVMTSLSEEDYSFLKEHPEVKPSGLLQKAIRDYREVLGEGSREKRRETPE